MHDPSQNKLLKKAKTVDVMEVRMYSVSYYCSCMC